MSLGRGFEERRDGDVSRAGRPFTDRWSDASVWTSGPVSTIPGLGYGWLRRRPNGTTWDVATGSHPCIRPVSVDLDRILAVWPLSQAEVQNAASTGSGPELSGRRLIRHHVRGALTSRLPREDETQDTTSLRLRGFRHEFFVPFQTLLAVAVLSDLPLQVRATCTLRCQAPTGYRGKAATWIPGQDIPASGFGLPYGADAWSLRPALQYSESTVERSGAFDSLSGRGGFMGDVSVRRARRLRHDRPWCLYLCHCW